MVKQKLKADYIMFAVRLWFKVYFDRLKHTGEITIRFSNPFILYTRATNINISVQWCRTSHYHKH